MSIVIPAYNEAKRIGPTLRAVATWLASQDFGSEIIVVDNASEDETVPMVYGLMGEIASLRLLEERRRGKGYAVQAGMMAAKGEICLFMDADNATSIDHFQGMRKWFKEGYDIVIGSLGVPGSVMMLDAAEPLWRIVMGKMGNLWIQLLAVPGIWDTQRGFKAFTARAVNEIFPRLTIFGWGFDIEVLAIARARGFKIIEVPVTWRHDPNSRVGVLAYPITLLDTLRVLLNRMCNRYRRREPPCP